GLFVYYSLKPVLYTSSAHFHPATTGFCSLSLHDALPIYEALAIRIDRKLNSTDVIDVLSDLFILRGVPEHIRSDNGPEFIATAVQDWITAVGAKTAYIAPGSPWEDRKSVV